MFRSVIVSLVVLALLQAAFASIDISKTKHVQIEFTDEDVVPKTMVKNFMSKPYAGGFIGNLEIGNELPDQTILNRVIIFDNPSPYVQSSSLELRVNGIIHFIRVTNEEGSYAVVCHNTNSVGSSTILLNIRVNPQTRSKLTLLLASH